ncbi:hypothetical protein [Dyadobacter sp. NIV53]|uniref:hypothetical protein n=1 Tax=Dyadobacter sp. NIV53 TaxID=2861765 RepID=UPI001C86C613|nr:hypothetical protein [Dyadobacter sp. NIV53]
MMDKQQISKEELIKIKDFLSRVSETNEDTQYDPSQENIVDAIITLVKELEKTSIVEDFNVPYIHPMITVQKWSVELKEIVSDLLAEKS